MILLQKISLFSFVATILLLGSSTSSVDAQMMGVKNFGVTEEVYEHTIREEAAGKELWEKLQAKQVACNDLADENFGMLGEYFMGAMMGEAHPAMNAMMIQTHGEEGEEQIHIAMGKRLSGCDPSAIMPNQGFGWMPMMNMMNNSFMNPMMGFGTFGLFGEILMILWWILIIVGIVTLARWLFSRSPSAAPDKKSALDILKERYAKGEINKQEFEEKKQDLHNASK